MSELEKDILLFASGNQGKLKEVRQFAGAAGLIVVSPAELESAASMQYGFSAPLPKLAPVAETASTYLENAKLKADAYFKWSGLPSLADDSGLEVTALGGGPGVFSARYAGMDADDEENTGKLLKEMAGKTPRTARFVCSLFLKLNENKIITAEGELPGEIALQPSGSGGFGYDPIFIDRTSGKILAELKSQGQTVETHRTRALRNLFSKLGDSKK